MSELDSNTETRVDSLLAAIVADAESVKDHLDNFEAHREELEQGDREPDDNFDEETTEEYEVWDRWAEGIYGMGKKAVFSYVLAGGGPSATLEVECDMDKTDYGHEYTVTDVWLEGAWAGPRHKVEVYRGEALWDFAERLVESQYE